MFNDGRPRPDYGPGMVERACPCGAGWIGIADDPCSWCLDAAERDVVELRRRLLWPDWLVEQGPRYDELDDDDRAVWDATRGIARGEASERTWARRLADAVHAGIVTEADARAALTRATSRRETAA